MDLLFGAIRTYLPEEILWGMIAIKHALFVTMCLSFLTWFLFRWFIFYGIISCNILFTRFSIKTGLLVGALDSNFRIAYASVSFLFVFSLFIICGLYDYDWFGLLALLVSAFQLGYLSKLMINTFDARNAWSYYCYLQRNKDTNSDAIAVLQQAESNVKVVLDKWKMLYVEPK